MLKILFLFPSKSMADHARVVLGRSFPEILVDHCLPARTLPVVAKYAAEGVGIIGARGGIAQALRESGTGLSFTDIPVVDIPVTAFDIIKAVTEARRLGSKIAVLALSQMVEGIGFLSSALGISVTQYQVFFNQDYDKAVREAVADGAEVIVGGVLATEAAKRLGVPNAVLHFGEDSLLRAAGEALRLRETLALESARDDLFRVVMNASRDGILITDADGVITGANRAAEALFRGKALAGHAIGSLLPRLSGKQARGPQAIVTVGKETLVCDAVPVQRDNAAFVTVYTLQRTSRIQKMEAMIREELYARGHVARFRFADVIGVSPAIRKAVELAEEYAETDSSVLILGETGTGKEVFAQSIHNAGKRASGPFVAVNCAAIPTHLLESELFGYAGGAFTGASKEGKPGLFEIAHGGTIFLDEMAEMDYANQGRLLRFHQERTVVRLGSYKVIPVDVRIIAATNKNLEELVGAGAFRDDLYYRLNVLRLGLPPLRQRTSDIGLYAESFLRQFAEESGRKLVLAPGAVRVLEKYPWPGNVRECRNIMERVAARLKSGTVTAELLEEMLGQWSGQGAGSSGAIPPAIQPTGHSERWAETRVARSPKASRQEREILEALEAARGIHGEAAKQLGIDRSTLYRRMKRLGLEY